MASNDRIVGAPHVPKEVHQCHIMQLSRVTKYRLKIPICVPLFGNSGHGGRPKYRCYRVGTSESSTDLSLGRRPRSKSDEFSDVPTCTITSRSSRFWSRLRGDRHIEMGPPLIVISIRVAEVVLVGSLNGPLLHHSGIGPASSWSYVYDRLAHKRAPKLQCILQSDISLSCLMALRQPLNHYGVGLVVFKINLLGVLPPDGIARWHW